MASTRKYISLLKTSMQASLSQRFNFFVNTVSGIVFVTALFYVWKAIFGDRDELNGMTWEQMKTYLLVVFITNMLLTWYSETAISRRVMDGSVAMDLLKPLDFQKARLSETVGTSIVEGGVCAIVAAAWAILFAGAGLPPDLGTSVLFLLSLTLSVLIKFGIVYLAGLVCFYTSSMLGVAWARAAVTNLFSGALVPLSMFPGWLQTIALWLPFQGIVYIPASIYMGRYDLAESIRQIGIQLLWAVLLWLAGKAVWRWSVRQVTIHGG
ncbi:MAG: antibiotic transport system permease [Paenibacillus sp.]|jgi:ABC-2 type transport system permease protein|uniref:ABC transporter permease n=1 Tax=Paenibacillus sp. GCM10012303 TaxID=3317340 RepID=UPI0029EF643F|nr:antibiotic transport system permease [Paenibacillus sp.]